MMLISVFLLILFHTSFGIPVEVTFQNVTFKGYNLFVTKFKPTILYGYSLKDYIPNSKPFDYIEFLDQKIPVLYKDAIADIDQLYELTMEHCEIKDIKPGAFRNLQRLKRMSFKRNRLHSIEEGVFNNLITLDTLDLSDNYISFIHPKGFDDMPQLFQINLARNRLSEMNPDWFNNTPKLSILNFKNNFIDKLPAQTFKNLKGKRYLIMDFIFDNNLISFIHPDAFDGIKQIHMLSLSNNSLKSFDKNLLKNVEIRHLWLNNNSISCFDDLNEVFKATYSYIEYNPIECNCLKKIQKWCELTHKDVGVSKLKCPDDLEAEETVIDIEDVRELTKDVFAIQKITLVLPKTKDPAKYNMFNNFNSLQ